MKDRGVTLLELLAAVAIVVVLASASIPSFQRIMAENRLVASYNDVLVGLNIARSEAIKRRRGVTFDVTNSAPWKYQVKVAGMEKPIRVRRADEGMVSMDDEDFTVTFDALGKATSCISGCRLSLTHSSVGDRVIEVNAMGRVGRGASS
ncbi:GspH/FimT family pseudopilin [Halomonas sp. THAF12]|uniref:GspH/FimT family pseudopilin n=1 Tax=Halomonas sp. B23F22_10 TaxID=3459515 RepID=UPI00373E67DB